MESRAFTRRRDGRLVVTLPYNEVELLRVIARDVASIVEAPPAGEIADRLYPRAYLDPTEEAAEIEFRELVHGDLVQSRLEALATIADTIDTDGPSGADPHAEVTIVLSAEQESQWLTALNDARLVIGTVLEIAEDDDGEYPPDDPRFEHGAIYQWLSSLHGEHVALLLDEIGDVGADDL